MWCNILIAVFGDPMPSNPILPFSLIVPRRLLVVSLVIVFLSYGCGGTPYKDAKYPLYNSYDIIFMHDNIQKGKTTEAEVMKRLGRPTIDTTDNLGRKKWIYLSYPYRGPETRLDVTFDNDGVVVDYRLDSRDGNR